jgi:hypothetical protein
VSLPEPAPGLVISFAYLWRREHAAGREEGAKDRPCAVVLVATGPGNERVVSVAPVTHRAPEDPALGIEIPQSVKRHLGLDGQRSWIICDEVNQFAWPGYDLRPRPGTRDQYHYGFLPPRLYEQVVRRIAELKRAGRSVATLRG